MGQRPTHGDEKNLRPATTLYRTVAPSFVIPRACDFFDLSVFCTPQPDVFNLHHKAVILSEAPRRSIAYRRVYGAESKDPGDACWQMLFGAFRPRTIRRVKKVTSSEQATSRQENSERETSSLFHPRALALCIRARLLVVLKTASIDGLYRLRKN